MNASEPNHPPAPPATNDTQRLQRAGVALVLLAALFFGGRLVVRHLQPLLVRSERLADLRSPDPQRRKQAAWALAELPDALLVDLIADELLPREPDPDVRESFVWLLGTLRAERHWQRLEQTIADDESGYVRAAAWLAAARCDAERCRVLARSRPPTDRWDRIGRAQAALCLGDLSQLAVLLDAARSGSAQQRYVASRALGKWLVPLLDTAGRWPINADVGGGSAWPVELVDEVARRCAALDLQRIADENRRLAKDSYKVHRHVRRVTNARNDLADLLMGRRPSPRAAGP